MLLEKIQDEFTLFETQITKLQGNLPLGKNLAQLQGTSRREKDAVQNFDETSRDLKLRLEDLGTFQPDLLVKNN